MQAIQFEELIEASIRGLIGRERVTLEPALAGKLVEVVAGVHGSINQRRIEDVKFRGPRGTCRSDRNRLWRLCVTHDGDAENGNKDDYRGTKPVNAEGSPGARRHS